jgi:hypothetical protein
MRQVRTTTLGLLVIAGVLGLGAVACSNDGTAPGAPLLSQAQADSLSEQLTLDAEDEILGATARGAASFSAVAPTVALSSSVTARCMPTRTPASPTDTHNDGVADSVRLDFAGCVLSWPLETDSIRGTIDVLDPTKALADHAVERIFTNLAHVRLFTISGKQTSETRSGTRMTSRDATTLQNSETNFRTDYVFRDGSTATHMKTWTSTFTADVAASIQHDQALPSGSWSVNGTSSWTRGTRTYSLTVTTNPPLHYNATCTTFPRFDAGTLTAAIMRNGQTMHVVIQFTGCGQYTVTRS